LTVQSVLKRQLRSIERLLEYELGRFTKIGIGVIPPVVLVVASIIVSLISSSLPATINLKDALFVLILLTAAGFGVGTIPSIGPTPIYTVSPFLLNILSPLPYPIKGTVAVLLTLRRPLYTYMYLDAYFIPAIVAALAASVMIFSSLVKEEDFFVLVREDRNRIQIFRSVFYAFVYSLLGALTVFIVRTYMLSQTPLISFLQPVFDTFCPILPLIPPFFIFLLAIQGVASLFNHFSERLVYLIPVFLLIELFIFQFSINMNSFTPNISDLIWAPEAVTRFYDNPEYFLLFILPQSIGQGYFSIVTYLPLFNMSALIHTFVFEYYHGIWNFYFFDPNAFLYKSAIVFNDDILFAPAYSNLLPSILFLNLVTELLTKPTYSAIGSLLYFIVPIIIIYTVNAIIFKRKTI